MAARSLSGSAAASDDDGLQVGDEILDAEFADRAKRPLLRRKVIVETGLSHAEPVSDVPGTSARITFFGKYGSLPRREPRGSGAPNAASAPIVRRIGSVDIGRSFSIE